MLAELHAKSRTNRDSILLSGGQRVFRFSRRGSVESCTADQCSCHLTSCLAAPRISTAPHLQTRGDADAYSPAGGSWFHALYSSVRQCCCTWPPLPPFVTLSPLRFVQLCSIPSCISLLSMPLHRPPSLHELVLPCCFRSPIVSTPGGLLVHGADLLCDREGRHGSRNLRAGLQGKRGGCRKRREEERHRKQESSGSARQPNTAAKEVKLRSKRAKPTTETGARAAATTRLTKISRFRRSFDIS